MQCLETDQKKNEYPKYEFNCQPIVYINLFRVTALFSLSFVTTLVEESSDLSQDRWKWWRPRYTYKTLLVLVHVHIHSHWGCYGLVVNVLDSVQKICCLLKLLRGANCIVFWGIKLQNGAQILSYFDIFHTG